MRSLFALVLVALLAVAFADINADSVTAVAVRDGFYRQLTVSASPSVANILNGTATGISVAAIGATVNSNGQGSGTAKADIAGFKFKNPSDASDNDRGLVFYFGYLGLSGTWDTTAKTASLSGALAEIASSWENIFIYYDHDNVPGFQLKLGVDFWNCNTGAAQGYDCVDPLGVITLNNVSWGGIQVSNTTCPAEYNNPDCKIWAFSTATTDGVFNFTLRLASEPVLVNDVRIEPNYGKIDVEINYPWASKTLTDAANAKVAIVAYTAGRAGTAGVSYEEVDGKKAVQYQVNDKSAYFSWDSQANVSGTATTVYADFHSGASIRTLDCAQCGFSLFYYIGLKARAGILEGLGWNAEMLLFSWNEKQPAKVFWDPAIGMTDAPDSASAAAVSLGVALVAIVARLF